MSPDWRRIVNEHGPVVWRTALRILGDPADAADCYQETFVAALAVSRRGSVASWPGLLQRIATVRSLDQLRCRIRERSRSVPEEERDQVASSVPDPIAELEASELGARLRWALSQLPEREATVFCLRELNELSHAEIGAALGISENAAGVAAHRTRRKLAEMLREFEPRREQDLTRGVSQEESS